MFAIVETTRAMEVRLQVIHAFRGIGPDAKMAVPALRNQLSTGGEEIQARSAHALESIGREGRAYDR